MNKAEIHDQATLLGHPTGLYTLFFAEMWERFSYYGMRALLVLYMIKGFLGFEDEQAYTVYGAYTALVYMTPFIGGMLADRILGRRIAIIIGGLFMSAGHLLMTVQSDWPFYFALALLIVGNGFFKPNISTTVGALYGPGDPRRDAGFNIFYTGINLGAAMSPLICGYVGETYGWHYGFGLATIGMLIGLAVFVMPNFITSALILTGGAGLGNRALPVSPGQQLGHRHQYFRRDLLNDFGDDRLYRTLAWRTAEMGRARPEGRDGRHDWKVYLGIALAIPTLALLVCGFSPFMKSSSEIKTNDERMAERVTLIEKYDLSPEVVAAVKKVGIQVEQKARGKPFQFINAERIEQIDAKGGIWKIVAVFLAEVSKPAGLVLTVIGALAFGFLFLETFRLDKVPRERMLAALILIFFNMLFFAFFEQAGSSINNFTDRNVDRVEEARVVTEDMVGQTIRLQPTQAQLGYIRDGEVFTLSDLDELRQVVQETGTSRFSTFDISWTIAPENVGMGIANRRDELPASMFQSVNAVFILIFAIAFNWMWAKLRTWNLDPSAPVKFGFGLVQLGLGFGAYYLGARFANAQGMVMVLWLILGYLLQTTGELCLSPVGLSTMTKLSPKHLVSTLMGAWFLATAFSQYLAAIISQFTSVGSEGGDTASTSAFPAPIETVNLYGGVFGKLALTAMLCGLVCLILSPVLKAWMHEDKFTESEG